VAEWKTKGKYGIPVPPWKVYEAQLHTQLSTKAKNAVVLFDHDGKQRLPGRFSRRRRQIDIIVRGEFEGLTVDTMIVDCKCLGKKKIDVRAVEQFVGLMRDVDVSLGLLVTTHGFTKAAQDRASAERGVLMDIVPFDELTAWALRKPSVSLTAGGSVGSATYFDGKVFVTRLLSRDLAERLFEKGSCPKRPG